MSSLVMFKSQLQEYTQKHSLSAPTYENVKEGPSHEPKFTASVIVNEIKYNSPTAFRNRKTAEHAAAQVALQELAKAANGAGGIPNPVFESGLCKNLLQEYAQKLNLPVPSYGIKKTGDGHTAIFISTVEIAGISYEGGPSKNKKTAEIKAARTALSAIQTQYCSQGAFTILTSCHLGALTNSTHAVANSGMKRERACDQPSGERTVVKNKKRKQSKKRTGKRRENTIVNGKQTTSAKNTSAIDIKDEHSHQQQVSINGGQQIKQLTTAENTLAIDIKDQQSHPQQMSVDNGQQIKEVEGLDSQETGQKSEDEETGQSAGEEVKKLGGALVDAPGKSEQHNQGGDVITDGLGKIEQEKQEAEHEICKFPLNKEKENRNGTPASPGNHEQDKQQSNQGIEKLPVNKEVQKVKDGHEEHGTQEAVIRDEISPLA